MTDLSDEQWLVLDLLMRARQKGVSKLNRMELLHNSALPQGVSLKLTWSALTMPKEFLVWHGQHDFAITDAGVQLYNLRFGNGSNPTPTTVADSVIYLPGPDHYRTVQ
jgi:hypothetical protein